MAFYDKFPYTNFQELNLDWITQEVSKVRDNRDASDASAAAALASEQAAKASENAASASQQAAANSETAAAGSEAASAEYLAQIGTHTAGAVADWLRENLTPTTPPIDASLKVSGAAADAKVTGDRISELNSSLTENIYKIAKPFNLYDGSVWPVDGFFNGSFNEFANFKTTNPIYLNAGKYMYPLRYDQYGEAGVDVMKSDSSGNITGLITATDTGKTYYTRSHIYLVDITESGYYRFNAGYGQNENSKYMIIRGANADIFPDEFIKFGAVLLQNNIPLTEAMKNQMGHSSLYGKKIVADGDSICYGNGYLGGYAKMISEKNDMSYQNIAVGGGTIAAGTYSGETPRHWICRSMVNLDSDADYVIIEGGVNDASLNVPLGTITPLLTDTLDDTTFYGAMETVCKILCTKFIGKKCAFLIPHGSARGMRYLGEYYKAVYDCCHKWGIPVIDIEKCAPPFDRFRGETNLDTIRNTYTTNGDGWHPTELCYRQYYVPKIESKLKEL